MRRNRFVVFLVWLSAAAALDACTGPANPVAPELASLTTEFTLRGRIWSGTSESEIVLPGVTVRATSSSNLRMAVTDVAGAFTVGGLSAGEWTLRASKPGYVDAERVVQMARDTTLNISLAPE